MPELQPTSLLNPAEKLRNLLATTSPLPWTHTWSSDPTGHNETADYVKCPLPPGKTGYSNVVMHDERYYNVAPGPDDMILCVVAVNMLPKFVEFAGLVRNRGAGPEALSSYAAELLAELGRQIDLNS